MTDAKSLASWRCLACRAGLHELCDPTGACECWATAVDGDRRIILCRSLEPT